MIFLYFTWGPESFYMVAAQTWGNMNKFTLVAVPLFIFMAMILERSGVANDLYEMMYLWFGPVGGGLAIGTVVICAIFSAMCGISGAAVVSMGTIALPSMLKRNYDKELALGCINSGGGWGILIPPSIIMILYSLISGESVGKLFAGGVFPGLLLCVSFPLTSPFDATYSPIWGRPFPGRSGETGRKIQGAQGGYFAHPYRTHGPGIDYRGHDDTYGGSGHGRARRPHLGSGIQATQLAHGEGCRPPHLETHRDDHVDSLRRLLLQFRLSRNGGHQVIRIL